MEKIFIELGEVVTLTTIEAREERVVNGTKYEATPEQYSVTVLSGCDNDEKTGYEGACLNTMYIKDKNDFNKFKNKQVVKIKAKWSVNKDGKEYKTVLGVEPIAKAK